MSSQGDMSQQVNAESAQGDADAVSPPARTMQPDGTATSDAPAAIENLPATPQLNESIEQSEFMDITDYMNRNNQQNDTVTVKNEASGTITAEQIAAHRMDCEDFNCPACLPMNLAIRELKTSRQNIDNILAMLEMKRHYSD